MAPIAIVPGSAKLNFGIEGRYLTKVCHGVVIALARSDGIEVAVREVVEVLPDFL